MGLQSSDVSIGDQIFAAQYNDLRTDALLGWAEFYNKSGGSLVAGDVVVVDATNDEAITTTTQAGDNTVIGVVGETIANNAQGRLYPPGAVVTVKVTGAVTRGHYLDTSTTAKLARDAGVVLARGVFAMALSSAAGPGAGTVTAMLFYSKTARGGFPTGLIVLYDAACPSGWTRFSALDGKYPKGATGYGGTGGANTHTHDYSDLPQHYHTNTAATGSASNHTHGSSGLGSGNAGAHAHTAGTLKYTLDESGWAVRSTSTTGNSTSSAGGHSHSVGGTSDAAGSHNHDLSLDIDSTGVASPVTESESSEPPYLEMIFCKKD